MTSPGGLQAILLGGVSHKVLPVWTADFLNTRYSWSWSGSAWVSSPAGLTYAGQSQKYQFDSTGTLTTGPNQVLVWSTTPTSWTGYNVGSTVSGNTFTATAGSGYHYRNDNDATLVAGTTVLGLAELKYVNNAWAFVTFPDDSHLNYVNIQTGAFGNLASGVTSVSSTLLANGSYQFVFKAAAAASSHVGVGFASGNGSGSFTAAGTEQIIVNRAMMAAVTYETAWRSQDYVDTNATAFYGPRQDYSYNGTSWVPAGMLVEQASSGNYAKYSQDFSQSAWRKYTSGAATGSISANSVTDPASTTTGAYISINRAAASEYAEYYQSFTGTAASWTGSFFLKAHAGGDVGKTVSIAAYNGSTVVAGTTVTLTASWVRYSVTGTMAASGSCNFAIGYVASTDYAGAPTQTGAVGFDVAFGQFDNTSFPLSYLPNPTASSPGPSRAADAINAPSYASNAAILQRKAQTTGTVDRIYYAPGALPEPFTTGYWYQSGAAYKRALTTQEQTPRLVVGGPY